ncbi:unnamed protein product, partial [marine sediment metagenome]
GCQIRKIRRKTRHIIGVWAEKEYKNLQRSSVAEINVPKPILVKKNILLMELLGKEKIPFPLLKNCPKAFTRKTFYQILDQTKLLFQKAGLVHADLSPFNILIGNGTPYLIDMSQSVLISHPRALEFLKRDLNNVLSSFLTKGVDIPEMKEVYEEITTDFPDKELIE